MPPPNYVNPETRVAAVVASLASTSVLMLLFLTARLYSRRALVRASFGPDDYVMVAAAIIALAVTVINSVNCRYGNGYHTWDVKPEWVLVYWKLAYTGFILLAPALSLTKISICMTYLRIFPSRANRLFCQCLIVFCACWAIAFAVAEIFQCTPIGSWWDWTKTDKKCINLETYLYATTATNSLSDVLVYLWPARQLWRIKIPLKQRLSLIFSFTLGCVVCVAGMVRLWNFSVYFASSDPFWEGAVAAIAQGFEYNLGIVCGCLPGVRPLLALCFPAVFDSSNHTRKPHSQLDAIPHTFPFQVLSGVGDGSSTRATARRPEAVEANESDETDATSTDTVPERGIRVVKTMTMQVEIIGSPDGNNSKDADARSEESIMVI